MIMLVLNGFLEPVVSWRDFNYHPFLSDSPFWYQEYNLCSAMRILFGLGVGMINAKAISISERYHGKTRIQMLGLRISRSCRGIDFDSSCRSTLILGMDSDLLAYSAGSY